MGRVIAILLLIFPFTVFGQKDSVDLWISKIDNTSIAGTCNYAWVIKPTTNEVNKLIKTGKSTEKKLLRFLTDERKGIVVHYILSNIYGQTKYYTLDMDSLRVKYDYNGLEFTETNDGMQTDRMSLEKCKSKWIQKLRNY